ncbi:hypothetical protein KP509_01G091000 [Ceratopteris richardii]|uniref:BTB domain-containing protein n=1 Tax=Ceratopteris richardii TaxID=49495 RepID=A0A8T2VIF6_CERRI|nr:hypothetical protein KP509_01G091000 [Ceratopteris richardii]
MSSFYYHRQHYHEVEDEDDHIEDLVSDDEALQSFALDEEEAAESEYELENRISDYEEDNRIEEDHEEEEEEAAEESVGDHGSQQEENMDIFGDDDDFNLFFTFVRGEQHNRRRQPIHMQASQGSQSNRAFTCLSCKERYSPSRVGTCRECYDEASEAEEALKKEIEELHARIAFLKTWVPEAMDDCADVVLECIDGSKIRAHRAVLISRSTVFKAMLESKAEEGRTNNIKITDFTYGTLRLFVHYLYTAEIYSESLEECAVDLLALAEKYNVKQLKALCERHMISKLNFGNALSNFEYASLHGAKNLKQAALSTILENMQELIGKAEYNELVNRDAKLVVEIFESYLAKQMGKAPVQ